jgi:glycosyltransferase involved in cell wall biosynthesis
MKFSVVLPCRNEEVAVEPVMSQFREVAPVWNDLFGEDQWEVLVVDDNSDDRSVQLIQRAAHNIPQLRCISSPVRLGYGGALKLGFQCAHGEVLSFLDMDNTYQAKDLLPLYEQLQERELAMVSGDRLSHIQDMPWTRKIGNRLFVTLTRLLYQREVKDCCSGMRVFRRKYIRGFSSMLPNELNFTLVMTLIFLRFELPFQEVPIAYKKRFGCSKLSLFLDGPRFLATILKCFWQGRYQRAYQRQVQKQFSLKVES